MWKKEKSVSKYSNHGSEFEVAHKGGEAADFTFGQVWARIWRNRARNGRIYYRASFNRIPATNEKSKKLSYSFSPEDLADLERSIARVQIWLKKYAE